MGAAPISVRLLGPVEVDVGADALPLRARLPRNLLVALALQPGRVVGIDTLITALWDDAPPDSALGTLQSYVSTLRRSLGDRDRPQPVLDRRGEGYLLVIPPDAVDTVRFEQQVAAARDEGPAAAEARLVDALALWRGPALADVATEPFARAAAARLDELRLGAEEARIDAGLALGRHQALVPEVEALVAAHPLREGLTGQLMVALYRSGRQADALRAFERTRAALVDELGISPSAALVALERAILRQEGDLLPAPSASATPVPPTATTPAPPPGDALPLAAVAARRGDGPFVGRTTELDRLLTAWEDRERARRVLAVNGDAGIGKTRLVAEVAARAHAGGGLVLWGTCTLDGGSTYRPFVEALRPLAAGVDRATVGHGPGAAALARLLPDLAGGDDVSTPVGTGSDRGPLFDAVTDLLARTTSGGRPTLVVIDDLQWADAASCALLVHLARAPELAHVRLALTYRTDEAALPHPSASALAELRRHRLVEQLPLAGLDEAATAELVAALAGGRADELDAELGERAEGNPFFVEELVAHGLSGADRLPVAVVDVVERRLAGLDPEHRRVLAAAAVLGRSFCTDLLSPVTGRSEHDLLDTIDLAVDAHLVAEDAPPVGRFAFAHALIRDGLLEGMTALRRTHIHLAAADALDVLTATADRRGPAAAGRGDDRAAELAHHLVQAGEAADPDRTVAALLDVARRALAVAAYDAAEQACRHALDRVELAAATPEATDVLLTLAEVRTAVGDAPGARQVYRWAADAARGRGDGARLGLAATGLGAGSGVGMPMDFGTDDERIRWLEEALALLPVDGDLLGAPVDALRARFLSHLAVATYYGDPGRCAAISLEAVAVAETVAGPTYRSAALIARRMALWTPEGDLDERVAVGAGAVEAADAGGDLLYRIVSRLAHLADLMEAALLDRYEAVLAEADDLCRPLHSPRWDWLCDLSAVSLLLLHGRHEEADEVLTRAAREVGPAWGTMPFHVETSCRIVMGRDRGGLAVPLERLAGVADLVPAVTLDAATGFAAAMGGDRAAAARHLAPHAAVGFADLPRDHLWTAALAWYAEMAHVAGDAPAARTIADLLAGKDERMICMGGLVAAGLVGRVRGVALATAGDLDGAVAVLDGALAGHRALGLRPWVAHTALDLARVLRWRDAPGDRDRATSLTAEGEGLAAALGLARAVEAVRPSIST